MNRLLCLAPVLALLGGCGAGGSGVVGGVGAGTTTAVLSSVACASARTCVAVGRDERDAALAKRWNGQSWKTEQTPAEPGDSGLASISCLDLMRCVAVGTAYWTLNTTNEVTPFSLVRSEGRWTAQPVVAPAGVDTALAAISCTTSSCVAVGEADAQSGAAAPVAERWDGERWRLLAPASPRGSFQTGLAAVSCPVANWCMVLGRYDTRAGADGQFAERWDGRRWTLDTISVLKGPETRLAGISCTSPDACMAVGSANFRTVAMHWDGRRWRVVPTPDVALGKFPNGGLAAVSCPSADDCTAVGSYHRIGDGYQAPCKVPGCAAAAGVDQTLSIRWNGATWRIEPTPDGPKTTSSDLFGVSCPTRRLCVEVGTQTALEP